MLRSRATTFFVIGLFTLALLPAWPTHTASAGVGSTVYLPNVTKKLGGEDGWQTPFIVQNVGADVTSVTMQFYAFSDGSLVKTRSVASLIPGTSVVHDPNSDPELAAGGQYSVVIRSTNSPVVSTVNEHQNVRNQQRQEALSYQGLSEGSTRIYAPYFAYNVNGWLTTLVVQNLGASPTSVNLQFISYDGSQKPVLTRTLEPGRAQFVDPRVEPSLGAGTEYAVSLSASQPIGLIVNAHNDAPTATAPMGFSYNGAPAANDELALVPYAAKNSDGVARSSRLFVQNISTVSATPTLRFLHAGSTVTTPPISLVSPTPLAPGATWAVDMATSSVLPDGDYGVYSTGGEFAIVGATTTPASAMGLTSITGNNTKWYLPNVTRTLGGANGWTTPIWIQSASFEVTFAKLSWYRFSDGALVTTQTVTGLAGGASVRVDPRSVVGLSDDTQYAVVVEAPAGGVAVVVTELNFSGGDGAMAYEGFNLPALGGYGTTGCTPITGIAGQTFRCRFFGLTPGAKPITVTTTNPVGSPATSTFQEAVASDGSFTYYARLTTQGNRTITVVAGGTTVNTTLIVGAPTFAVQTTQAKNGSISIATKGSTPCTMYALQPDGNLTVAFGVILTATSDAAGLLTFSYTPLTSPAGTWLYVVQCTSGSETHTVAPTFTVP